MDNIYENIEGYNPMKKQKTLIVFDDIIADMLSNKELNWIVNHSSDINFQYFINIYKRCTVKPYYILVIDTAIASDSFRKNIKSNHDMIPS